MATIDRQKIASMDVIVYVLYLIRVDMRLKHTAESATHEIPSSACGWCSLFACSVSSGRCSGTCVSNSTNMGEWIKSKSWISRFEINGARTVERDVLH